MERKGYIWQITDIFRRKEQDNYAVINVSLQTVIQTAVIALRLKQGETWLHSLLKVHKQEHDRLIKSRSRTHKHTRPLTDIMIQLQPRNVEDSLLELMFDIFSYIL